MYPISSVGFTHYYEQFVSGWVDARDGTPYFFRGYKASRQGGFAWLDEAAQPEDATSMWYELMGHLGFSRESCEQIRLTPYGTRHILPDVTREMGWLLEKRMDLGRWSLAAIRELLLVLKTDASVSKKAATAAQASARSAMAKQYSRGAARLFDEAALRREATGIVRDYIAGREWWEVVPIQRQRPTFGFLRGELLDRESGPDSSGDESIDDMSDDDSACVGAGAVAGGSSSGASCSTVVAV